MRIFEEYFQRHNIIDVPLVHHCTNGTLLLETNKKEPDWNSRWVLVTIKWVEGAHYPGEYLIEFQTPNYDCINNLFSTIHITRKWHEYEDFILQCSSSFPSFRPITNSSEILIIAWEMFVFMHDSWFAKQSTTLKNKLFQSLNKENDLEIRYSNYQDVVCILAKQDSILIQTWEYNILFRTQNCANWLAYLIENQNKKRH